MTLLPNPNAFPCCVDQPASYPRRILLAVVGMTPQILTETLYALTQQTTPAFVPTEIHIMTTEEGKRQLENNLLDPKTGAFHAFCADYGLTGKIQFSVEQIAVLQDENGVGMEDVRTPQDNARTADQLVNWVRQFTDDPNAALHVSLAGGRKTMGFFIGYALSLLGRQQDRLSHVLVSELFEKPTKPKFFFPPKEECIFELSDGKTARSSDAVIHLAEIPFVRLRDDLPENVQKGKTSYSDSVAAAQRSLGPKSLSIDTTFRRIFCGGQEIKMQPITLAFYTWHARRRKELGEAAYVHWSSDEAIHQDFLQEYADILNAESPEDSKSYQNAEKTYGKGFSESQWSDLVRKVKDSLEVAVGRNNAQTYLFARKKMGKGHAITLGLEPAQIRFL